MTAIQKCLGLGGACKVKTYFCHCCPHTSSKYAEPNTEVEVFMNPQLKQQQRPDWLCFHHSMLDSEQLREYRKSLDHLKAQWNTDMEVIRTESKLKLSGSQFKYSIDYIPQDLQFAGRYYLPTVFSERAATPRQKHIKQES